MLTPEVFVVLSHPLVFGQTTPGGAKRVLTVHQPRGVHGRRFRGQLFPGFPGLQLTIEQRAPFLLQPKLRLPQTFSALGHAFLPAAHEVMDHQ